MASHRFKVGQRVIAVTHGVPSGPYMIVRLLPLVGNDPQYQARSDTGTLRALLEPQIRVAPDEPDGQQS